MRDCCLAGTPVPVFPNASSSGKTPTDTARGPEGAMGTTGERKRCETHSHLTRGLAPSHLTPPLPPAAVTGSGPLSPLAWGLLGKMGARQRTGPGCLV